MIRYEKYGFIVRDAEREDIFKMKDSLRKSDIDEVWASDHYTPEQALTHSFDVSVDRFTVMYKGEPVAMFGSAPETLLGETAIVWMLTTEAINKVRTRFLKVSRGFIRFMQKKYPFLFNFVDCRHEASINWLKWCGAIFSEPIEFGKEKMKFAHFYFGVA